MLSDRRFLIAGPFSRLAASDKLYLYGICIRQVTMMSKSTYPSQIETERGHSARDDEALIPVGETDSQFESYDFRPSAMKRPGERSAARELLIWLTRSFAILALLSSFALLCVGATPLLTPLQAHIGKAAVRVWAFIRDLPLSALPLLLAGSSYIVLQAILRPRPLELFKRLMLGVAFLLWGVVQLMPASDLATELGNVVIALYVVDLGLMIWTDLDKTHPRYVR